MLSLQSSLVTSNAINLQYQREVVLVCKKSKVLENLKSHATKMIGKKLGSMLVLLPVEELENMCMKLTVVLSSGPV
ncbi:hypothetical protein EB796_000710 [Bugula neritina]|uniref:Uncharacterized protein n=1 Tax=Bugula neritina TaxID=10212 RepID=A0A7J7KSC0_BUGNE|nr:hypothetical protein EB796_000710 [Bugula neritina]